MSIPHAMVKPVYRSLKLFNDLCYDPRNMVEYKLNPGESQIGWFPKLPARTFSRFDEKNLEKRNYGQIFVFPSNETHSESLD